MRLRSEYCEYGYRLVQAGSGGYHRAARSPVSGIWYLVSGIWYLVSGIWCLVSSAPGNKRTPTARIHQMIGARQLVRIKTTGAAEQ